MMRNVIIYIEHRCHVNKTEVIYLTLKKQPSILNKVWKAIFVMEAIICKLYYREKKL